jgi:tetratricopeptide (TPR) repeat protein
VSARPGRGCGSNAQLTDCATGHQLWADRYDRDLTDIFAIQDEISKAIVAALQLQLLPKEKKAIERRGTSNPDAYSVYLLARQHWINGNYGDRRRDQMVVRVCRQATAIDPDYADAWALMALAQTELRFLHGTDEDGLPAAERALALDPDVPVALCVKARYQMQEGELEEAQRQLEAALSLDPDSFEVNKELAYLTFRQNRVKDAIPFFEKAVSLMESDYRCAGHADHLLPSRSIRRRTCTASPRWQSRGPKRPSRRIPPTARRWRSVLARSACWARVTGCGNGSGAPSCSTRTTARHGTT